MTLRVNVGVLLLVGLLVLGIPAGLSLVRESTALTPHRTTVPPGTQAVPTSTSPLPLPTDTSQNLTPTGTHVLGGPTTPSPTATGAHNDDVLLVDDRSPVDGEDCPTANYEEIQPAVDAADTGDTVVVCAGRYAGVDVDTPELALRARGDAEITGTGRPAVLITAPKVVLSGFTARVTGTNRTIVVGARNALLRNTTVFATLGPTTTGPAVGVHLSDGLTAEGRPDPRLAEATGSRIVDGTFDASTPPEANASAFAVWADADRTTVRASSFSGRNNASSVYSTGNDTVIRDNDVRYPNPKERVPLSPTRYPQRPAIQVGAAFCFENRRDPDCSGNISTVTTPPAHDWATGNVVANNSIDGAPRNAVMVLEVAGGTVVRDNSVQGIPRHGMNFIANDTTVRSNTLTDVSASGIRIIGYNNSVLENTIDGTDFWGILTDSFEGPGNVLIRGNTLRNNDVGAMLIGRDTTGRVVRNTITNNENGIVVYTDPSGGTYDIEAHHNRIWQNSGFGVWVYNFDPTDGDWPVFNATANVWGCGGPSGGLRDPVTDRVANGTGDAVSAGDERGYSNVHFDPFQERSSCPSLLPTSTPTVTPTVTTTRTPTPSPTPSLADSGRTGTKDTTRSSGTTATGAAGGNGTSNGSDGQTGPGAGNDAEREPPDADLVTPEQPTRRSATTAPSTPTTPPVTPRVEPGFGGLASLLGVAIFAGLLGVRRRF